MYFKIDQKDARSCYELYDHLNDVLYQVEKIGLMLGDMLDDYFFLDEVHEDDLPGIEYHYEKNRQYCNIAADYAISAVKDLKKLIAAGDSYFEEHKEELVTIAKAACKGNQ